MRLRLALLPQLSFSTWLPQEERLRCGGAGLFFSLVVPHGQPLLLQLALLSGHFPPRDLRNLLVDRAIISLVDGVVHHGLGLLVLLVLLMLHFANGRGRSLLGRESTCSCVKEL